MLLVGIGREDHGQISHGEWEFSAIRGLVQPEDALLHPRHLLGSSPIVNTCTRLSRRHALRIAAAVGLSGLLSAATIGSAFADTVSDKRAQAQSLAAQIDALGNKEAALSEQYDKAVLGTQTTG